MYKYKITDETLMGRHNMFTLKPLFFNDEIMLSQKQILEPLIKNEITNAIPRGERGRPHYIPDTLENMRLLLQVMGGNPEILVYMRERPKGSHRYYIKLFNQQYQDITKQAYLAISRYKNLTESEEISVTSAGDPVLDLIRLINSEAKECGMTPFISENYSFRKKLGTGRGGDTKLVNRCLEEAGLPEYRVQKMKTGEYGFYKNGSLVQYGKKPDDMLNWLKSVTVFNKKVSIQKVMLAISIFENRKVKQ